MNYEQVEAKIYYINSVEEMTNELLQKERDTLHSEVAKLNEQLMLAHEKLRIVDSEFSARYHVCMECRTEWTQKPSDEFGAGYKSISCPNCYRDTPM